MSDGARNIIRIGSDYITMDAITYIKKNPDGSFTVYLKGSDHTLTVKEAAKEFEAFLTDHILLSLLGDTPTGGRHSGPLR
jgi:hypothetical protein